MLRTLASFNSTLVQLKAIKHCMENGVEISFNSTLVQLKDGNGNVIEVYKNCFNSTLVQLKEDFGVEQNRRGQKFQFYLSSIKSRPVCTIARKTITVSILP